MKASTRAITQCALLTCAALVLSLLEGFIPAAMVPVPGIKLGLANIAVLVALYLLGARYAWAVLICKCVLASVFGGGITSLAFSLTGGVLALGAMVLLKRLDGKIISIYGLSISGAALHSIGQILAACVMLKTASVIYYLPALLISCVFTGAVTGAVAALVLASFRRKIK